MSDQTLDPTIPAASVIARAVVRIHAEFYGRGPERAWAVIAHDVVTVILDGLFTTAERTLITAGQFEHVRQTRIVFQDEVEPLFRQMVEETTGRRVRGFFSQIAPNDMGAEVFVLEPLVPAE